MRRKGFRSRSIESIALFWPSLHASLLHCSLSKPDKVVFELVELDLAAAVGDCVRQGSDGVGKLPNGDLRMTKRATLRKILLVSVIQSLEDQWHSPRRRA